MSGVLPLKNKQLSYVTRKVIQWQYEYEYQDVILNLKLKLCAFAEDT